MARIRSRSVIVRSPDEPFLVPRAVLQFDPEVRLAYLSIVAGEEVEIDGLLCNVLLEAGLIRACPHCGKLVAL